MIDVKALAQDLYNISEDIALLENRIEALRNSIAISKNEYGFIELCPECGSNKVRLMLEKHMVRPDIWYGECWSCGYITEEFYDRESATEAWNNNIESEEK